MISSGRAHPRPARAARRDPGRPAWPPRDVRSPRRERPGLDQAAGSASSSSISRRRTSASAISRSIVATLRIAFFDGPAARLPPRDRPLAGAAAASSLCRCSRSRGVALVPGALVLGPAPEVVFELASLADDRPAPDGLEQRPVVGDEDDGALVLEQRVLERLAALDVEVVRRLVEDQDVRARGDEDRQRQAPLLSAADVGELLLDLVAGEEEAAEQVAGLLAAQAGAALDRVEDRALARRACRRAGRDTRG